MINHIKLKFGAKSHSANLETDITPITIFVGPNNSGKSMVLSEINQYCSNALAQSFASIIDNLEFDDRRDLKSEISQYLTKPIDEYLENEQIKFGKGQHIFHLGKSQLLRIISDPKSYKNDHLTYFMVPLVLVLSGNTRINLIEPKPTGDLSGTPPNNLAELFLNDIKRAEVRKIIYDAFGKYFVIDPTNSGTLHIKMSNAEPQNADFERSLSKTAIDYYRKTTPINQFSDGVKAFTGIITSIIAGDPKIILIDEPEAFLHPSLAFKLGREIGKTAIEGDKRVFASTHSSNFLMGCIQSGVPLNIIRLTYSNNIPTARLLPKHKVAKLMKRPLLRSTGVLNALFYEYVIVTEADADRAFYQEINERLLIYEPDNGIPNCLFLNAQNKQTIHEIIGPLREMGIPCAAIVDVDIIKEGGKVWTSLMTSAAMPDATVNSTATARGIIKSKFDAKGVNFKKEGGLNVLDKADNVACHDLFDQLANYGVFTVRNGELESWLKPLEIKATHSPEWLIEAFEKLGEDPTLSNYIKPSVGDIWDFIKKIKVWFSDSNRKGIPE